MPLNCQTGQGPAIQEFLYFGTDMPEGSVSAEDWAGFIDETFAQGFPDGFTVWEASGQWRSAAGEVLREPSYVISLVHPGTAQGDAQIREFMAVYKTAFRQEAVLRVTSNVCISL